MCNIWQWDTYILCGELVLFINIFLMILKSAYFVLSYSQQYCTNIYTKIVESKSLYFRDEISNSLKTIYGNH